MTKRLNLLDEPWLPVRMVSGGVRELGLLALFEQASQVVALAETAPPSLMAQYRLLLAIMHRALSTQTPNWGQRELRHWYSQGFPTEVITTYLEAWRDRFWLFHPEHPFMQVAELATAPETCDKFKPWTQIDLASVSGNAPVVFNHSLDSAPGAISPSHAIRHLLGFLQCTPGGLVKVFRDADKAGPLANTAASLPLGETLAQTLLLGLHPASADGHEDLPCWERPALTVANLQAAAVLATGPNDRYTRQTRAVLFHSEEDGTIRWLRFAAGMGLEEYPHAPDPMASFREGSNGPVRLTFSEGRALWRDLPALLPDGGSRPAAILENATSLNKSLGKKQLRLLVAGLASDQAKLLRWRVEQLKLPLALLELPKATRAARQMLETAETLFGSLKGAAVQLIADTLPDSQQKDTRSRARTLFAAGPAAPLFFARAECALMATLTLIEQDADAAERQWQQVLKEAVLAAWEAQLTSLGGGANVWRANAKAQSRLWFAIRDQLTALNDTGEVQ
ncbi:type I-E CRISPR-associated protein Cse1/CasA [Serratia oryzae]|uniref:Type I-E CRISPR-associated protein Cse1/CasA n=1 Tax=Serratia oryzae TaxID=2034155 RepID=A0A1S8CL49_9GAMM|nr:type I-E CRISPR-associated protein Cse1/CasA [Serratia oryzae]OMQ24582.1 type I-E CRISPR-associated protein Cse1/CasA [Serratia oryzae]VXD06292.1 Type I-E CRISPR-associated protein Cse1/CasA [Enterobacterales bacterium 8AC]